MVRFSGTLSISFIPSNPSQSTPTTMTFNFLDDYRLDLSVRSLLGSRSRLQDVPKIAQLVESRLHRWFDERCVEPRFQEIALPNMWPRKKNTRGPEDSLGGEGAAASAAGGSVGKARGKEVAGETKDEPPRGQQNEGQREGSSGRDKLPESLRFRRRHMETEEFAMPGGLPGLGVSPQESASSATS